MPTNKDFKHLFSKTFVTVGLMAVLKSRPLLENVVYELYTLPRNLRFFTTFLYAQQNCDPSLKVTLYVDDVVILDELPLLDVADRFVKFANINDVRNKVFDVPRVLSIKFTGGDFKEGELHVCSKGDLLDTINNQVFLGD